MCALVPAFPHRIFLATTSTGFPLHLLYHGCRQTPRRLYENQSHERQAFREPHAGVRCPSSRGIQVAPAAYLKADGAPSLAANGNCCGSRGMSRLVLTEGLGLDTYPIFQRSGDLVTRKPLSGRYQSGPQVEESSCGSVSN